MNFWCLQFSKKPTQNLMNQKDKDISNIIISFWFIKFCRFFFWIIKDTKSHSEINWPLPHQPQPASKAYLLFDCGMWFAKYKAAFAFIRMIQPKTKTTSNKLMQVSSIKCKILDSIPSMVLKRTLVNLVPFWYLGTFFLKYVSCIRPTSCLALTISINQYSTYLVNGKLLNKSDRTWLI